MVGSFYFLIKYYARLTEDQKKTYNARQALYMKEKRAKESGFASCYKGNGGSRKRGDAVE